jgi:hypothetical protein
MKYVITLLLIFEITLFSTPKGLTISGIVSDENGMALPAATIVVKSTLNGTSTDFDGYYEIEAAAGDVLVFSYVGYETKEITVRDTKEINIQLLQDSSLDEVVVTALGIKRDSKLKHHKSSSTSIALNHKTSEISRSINQKYPHSQLTAGEIRDLNKWEEWIELQENKEVRFINKTYGFGFSQPIEVVVQNKDCKPLSNITIKIFDDNLNHIMSSKTDNLGKTYVFKDAFQNYNSKYYTIQIIHGVQVIGKKINRDWSDTIHFELDAESKNQRLDIMFTIDATGSMGDEINYLKAELSKIFTTIDTSIESKRLSLVFYRDKGDAYVTKPFNFNSDIDLMQKKLGEQNAGGGGDYEEAVEEALKVSLQQSWETDSTKLLFLLLDAPPHITQENIELIKANIKMAQERGIKIIPIVASDANKNVEYLMRYFSVATNGTYIFLTDDSGIGNSHIKPSIKDFKVEKLNDLIVRLIKEYTVGV